MDYTAGDTATLSAPFVPEIASKEKLEKEVLAIIKERSEKQIKINWQFSIETAREKLNRHYKQVNPENAKC